MRRPAQVPAVITLIDPDEQVKNKILVTINGQDWQKNLSDFGLTFDSSDREIMERISSAVQEEFGEDISDSYKIRKATNTQNIYVIPSSVAGI
jgi:hypothetical protein